MDFNYAVLILSAIILGINARKYIASDFGVAKSCLETQRFKTQQYVESPSFHYSKDEHGLFIPEYAHEILDAQSNYSYRNAESQNFKRVCCEGYQNYDENRCIPVCNKSCGSEGICASPGNCTCNEGFKKNPISQICEPHCTYRCKNGDCIAPNFCSCHEGYMLTDDNRSCKPICQNGTETYCKNLELCVKPGVCRCIKGYGRKSLERKIESEVYETCTPICERNCIHGDCVAPNVCKCHENYTQVYEYVCERSYEASNFTVPKNCNETKIVRIETKFPYEEKYLAKESEYRADDSWRGYKKEPDVYEKRTRYNVEYSYENQTVAICCDGYQNYDEENCIPVCSQNCGPHGICSEPNVCRCDEGYNADGLGECKPVCESECINGKCTYPNYCSCNEGYKKSSNDYNICEPI